MSRAGLDDVRYEDQPVEADDRIAATPAFQQRRTPRTSLIVVLPDNHVVSPDRLAERLPAEGAENVDIIVACAGQPVNLADLQRRVRDAQFLLAPAGTSTEDLRELAMKQAPGDIVSLLNGITLPMASRSERESLNFR
jgi:hypothetical protein